MQPTIFKYRTYQACVNAARYGQMLSSLVKKQGYLNNNIFVQFPNNFDLKLFTDCPKNRFGKPTCECHRSIDKKLIIPTYNYNEPEHTFEIIKFLRPYYVVFEKNEFMNIDIDTFMKNIHTTKPIIDVSNMRMNRILKANSKGYILTSSTENYYTEFKTVIV